MNTPMYKVCVVGAGSWGTTISKIIAKNIENNTAYDQKIYIWNVEEYYDGELLADIINHKNMNTKYLPDVKLPQNIECIGGNDLTEFNTLIFAVPCEYLTSVMNNVRFNGESVTLSVIKGFVDEKCTMPTEYLSSFFKKEVGVLMGPNLALEISKGEKAETSFYGNEIFVEMLHCNLFLLNSYDNKAAIEICGILKNLVAIGFGIAVGLEAGYNQQALVLRNGIDFMRNYLKMKNISTEVLFQPCGFPDIFVTCLGGRNRKLGELIGAGEKVDGNTYQGKVTARNLYLHLGDKRNSKEFNFLSVLHDILYSSEDDYVSPTTIYKCD